MGWFGQVNWDGRGFWMCLMLPKGSKLCGLRPGSFESFDVLAILDYFE